MLALTRACANVAQVKSCIDLESMTEPSTKIPCKAYRRTQHPGDNDCLYSVALAQLRRLGLVEPMTPRELRAVVHGWCQGADAGAAVVNDLQLIDLLALENMSLSDLAARTQQPGQEGWGGTEEVLAIAYIFEVNFEILTFASAPGFYSHCANVRPPNGSTKTITALYVSNSHYDELTAVPPPAVSPRALPTPAAAPARNVPSARAVEEEPGWQAVVPRRSRRSACGNTPVCLHSPVPASVLASTPCVVVL